eukprot:scaffold12452_cov113-Isochrysis_galbana.AAC.11
MALPTVWRPFAISEDAGRVRFAAPCAPGDPAGGRCAGKAALPRIDQKGSGAKGLAQGRP